MGEQNLPPESHDAYLWRANQCCRLPPQIHLKHSILSRQNRFYYSLVSPTNIAHYRVPISTEKDVW